MNKGYVIVTVPSRTNRDKPLPKVQVIVTLPPQKKKTTRASTAALGRETLTGIILAILFITTIRLMRGSKKKRRARAK